MQKGSELLAQCVANKVRGGKSVRALITSISKKTTAVTCLMEGRQAAVRSPSNFNQCYKKTKQTNKRAPQSSAVCEAGVNEVVLDWAFKKISNKCK